MVMQYKFFKKYMYICLLLVSMAGCKSTSMDKPETVELTKNEYLQLIEVSEQWQEAKDGIQRLLAVESDLKMLIGELDVLVKAQTKEQKQYAQKARRDEAFIEPVALIDKPSSSVSVIEKTNVVSISAIDSKAADQHKKAVENKTVTANYALQVAAVTEQERLQKLLAAVVKKAPEAQDLAVNIEVKNIKKQQYYRLKLGAFSDKLAAQTQCERFKLKQVSCIVSYYTKQTHAGLL